MITTGAGARVARLDVSVYSIPTDSPESDGTFEWDHTVLVLVEIEAAGERGLGYTYGSAAAASIVRETLAPHVLGRDALAIPALWTAMTGAVRNMGRPGVAATAISAVDVALWDLKARILGLPLVALLGAVRDAIPVYGSGGFTSYPNDRLADQLGRWAGDGMRFVKMKVGRDPAADRARLRVAREAIGPDVELLIDANGAFDRKGALAFAADAAEAGVVWFEEPVPSDDLAGLRVIRDHAPAGMEITAGEYGWDAVDFRRMLEAGAVDVLQPDATRCLGVTGFLAAAALCDAFGVPLSSHTAPSLHAHLCCAVPRARHAEYFHDHVRIEQMLMDGAAVARDGVIRPDLGRPGLGLTLKKADADRFRRGGATIWAPSPVSGPINETSAEMFEDRANRRLDSL